MAFAETRMDRLYVFLTRMSISAMSLFSALTIAVEGLNAQSTSINNVSNNISNAETVGL
jgi:hypothetical protein